MYVCLNVHHKRRLIDVRTVRALSKLWSKYYFLKEAAAEACEMVIKMVIHIPELQVYHLPMWWETTDGAMHYTQHVMTGLHKYSRSVILSLCAFVVGVLLFFVVAFVVLSKDRLKGFCLNSIFGY